MKSGDLAQLQFAQVGCGLVGRKRAVALGKIQRAALAYACDSDPARAAEVAGLAPGCKAATVEAALADPTVDAVIVSTPNAELARIALAAVRAGKHVLIEKPGALNTAELREVQAEAARKGVRALVSYNLRHHPALRKARELVDGGQLGELMFLRGRYGHGGRKGYEREWRGRPGGGELIDQGVHLIDLAGWFLGEFAAIDGHVVTSFWDMPVDDNAFVSLRTAAGQTAWLHASCTEWKNLFSLEIYGRQAKIAIDGLGGSYGAEQLTLYRMLPEMGPPETTVWKYPGEDDSWKSDLEAFCADIRDGGKARHGLDGAIRTLEIVNVLSRKNRSPT